MRHGLVVAHWSPSTLCCAQLVLGWVTFLGSIPPQYLNQQPRPTQPSILSGMENEYRPKGSDAECLAVKAGMARYI